MIGPDGAPGGVDHDIVTGDSFVSHGQAPWISEMFGTSSLRPRRG